MINAEAILEAEQRRLAWRCRRGMLELDIILQRFVESSYKLLTLDQLRVFDDLISLPDSEFLAILQSATVHKDPRVAQIVHLINPSATPIHEGQD